MNTYLITLKNAKGNTVEQFFTGAGNLRLALAMSESRLCLLDAGHGQTAVKFEAERLGESPDSIIERTYFRVPNFTGYGEEFKTFSEAVENAKGNFDSEHVRQWVEARIAERVVDDKGVMVSGSDHLVARCEVPNPLTKN